ncbi:hypothetical protein FOCG_00588 [Fusarium oxysporum f. sp. radicis-lycopersici 26381]|uniref:Uncharacterized protein n=1 Tax=Fusarium oxysporum Fo47 TaxID=660027 RepID=W9KIC2_FUSOX|nr:hypothetical protein FOZG_05086 [Fusarium oxysporum Fo47]EWZ98952.1 hypothetical protein FOWG_02799 [Fusarium oxysporum f. sp. lycopersici MN25]EXL61505.1 hypothetical protein FOCG_00588 [Fusarium oxysporum f. sp. radicis-lycopersici 26381]
MHNRCLLVSVQRWRIGLSKASDGPITRNAKPAGAYVRQQAKATLSNTCSARSQPMIEEGRTYNGEFCLGLEVPADTLINPHLFTLLEHTLLYLDTSAER